MTNVFSRLGSARIKAESPRRSVTARMDPGHGVTIEIGPAGIARLDERALAAEVDAALSRVGAAVVTAAARLRGSRPERTKRRTAVTADAVAIETKRESLRGIATVRASGMSTVSVAFAPKSLTRYADAEVLADLNEVLGRVRRAHTRKVIDTYLNPVTPKEQR